jgi:hypothetical protein
MPVPQAAGTAITGQLFTLADGAVIPSGTHGVCREARGFRPFAKFGMM